MASVSIESSQREGLSKKRNLESRAKKRAVQEPTNCWRQLVSDRMRHQEVAAQYPEIRLSTFQRAVQYIARDGKNARGAEAGVLLAEIWRNVEA